MDTVVASKGISFTRLLDKIQRLYGRMDDVTALLDMTAQTLIDLLEEIDPRHSDANHLLGVVGLISRSQEGTFRPLRLKGRPDPEELRSFVEHVGPGDSECPTGLMGWSVARRMAAIRQGNEWFVAERNDEVDRWAPVRPASETEIAEMKQSVIRAYPSIRSQMAVPILDPEIRGQARPRDTIGILNVESDCLLSDEFRDLMIGFGSSVGYPFRSAVRMRDLPYLCRRLSTSIAPTALASTLLDVAIPHLPRGRRRGFVALRDSRDEEIFTIQKMTTADLNESALQAYRGGKLQLSLHDGLWGEAIRTGRMQYLPDLSRSAGQQHEAFWSDSRSVLAIPLISGHRGAVVGLIGLESGETTYAFSPQDQSFFKMEAQIAAVAAAAIEETRLEYAEAVRIPAILKRLKCDSLLEVPEDQIVRINSICRALVKQGFVFQKAAEECRMTVHILREYTSRSPRIIDVDALRTLAIRREEGVRTAGEIDLWPE